MNVPTNAMLIALSLASLSACAAPQTVVNSNQREAVLAGQHIRLVDTQGRCTLIHADDPPMAMDMQWPCQFSQNKRHELRVENYRGIPVIMIERSEPEPAPSNDCTTDLQAVRLFKGVLEAAPVSRIAMCGPGQWDQKAFFGLFNW